MSLLEVIQLVGYSVGAALPLWMSLLLARQRHELARAERVLLALAVGIGLWHASNLVITLQHVFGLDVARWSFALRLADTVAVTSITFSYSLLLHVHLHLWARSQQRELTRFERARVWLSYVPTLFLAISIWQIWRGDYAPMLVKLSFFVLPFGVWAGYVLALVAVTDYLIARASDSESERRLMHTLSASFVAIAVLLVAAYALGVGRGTETGEYLRALANLGSILPTALIAYYIYRYRYLELIIQESLVVATFAAVVLVVYLYGIRTLAAWLTTRFGLRAGVIETLLVLAFAFVFAPLRAWLERRFHKLFEREAALYREVLTRIGAQSGRFGQLPELLRLVEARTAEELGLRRVRFSLPTQRDAAAEENATNGNGAARATEKILEVEAESDQWIAALFELARAGEAGGIEWRSRLRAHEFEAAYVLRRDEEVLGLMLVDASAEALTEDVRSVLEVLAGQVAIAIEDHRLMEVNLHLERKLAQGQRLAALGQLAATVAHEVKNPLSAIKSIAQVMREDERVTGEYSRDLELIVGEADRLSRSVTQLLSFAREPPHEVAPARADDVTRAVVELFSAQARAKGVRLEVRADAREMLEGAAVAAMRDALSNLVLNALQATPAGGTVRVGLRREGDFAAWSVADEGAGVPAELRRRIWEPFFTTKQRGTGLGLAIVHKRVEDVGGEARLAPAREGEGARFELRLPIMSAAKDKPERVV
ncbi:MAG: two-component system, NtrC family, sensor histidine kinase HydH [Acidobacteriota bacterium]|jgi:signal transduction histidine kinase|nr:two-component system, NtrC family, sensor histidine kinase HydH [Acidobacteriota bacterium]